MHGPEDCEDCGIYHLPASVQRQPVTPGLAPVVPLRPPGVPMPAGVREEVVRLLGDLGTPLDRGEVLHLSDDSSASKNELALLASATDEKRAAAERYSEY